MKTFTHVWMCIHRDSWSVCFASMFESAPAGSLRFPAGILSHKMTIITGKVLAFHHRDTELASAERAYFIFFIVTSVRRKVFLSSSRCGSFYWPPCTCCRCSSNVIIHNFLSIYPSMSLLCTVDSFHSILTFHSGILFKNTSNHSTVHPTITFCYL